MWQLYVLVQGAGWLGGDGNGDWSSLLSWRTNGTVARSLALHSDPFNTFIFFSNFFYASGG